jgi:hypothetical protein
MLGLGQLNSSATGQSAHTRATPGLLLQCCYTEAAARIAEQKAEGALGAAALSAADRVSLERALALPAENQGIGNADPSRLVEIVRDCARARASLPSGVTLAETAQFYK